MATSSSIVSESSEDEIEEDSAHLADESSSSTTVSLLDRLQSPEPSDYARKRKTTVNPPKGKRKSHGGSAASSSNPLTIKPEQRLKEHPEEPFSISNRKLFCQGCREEICVKSSSVKNHIKSNKHQEGKKCLQRKEARERDIANSLHCFNSEIHPRGETVSEAGQIFRVKVVRSFLKAGVPLSKVSLFREILEETGYRLTDRRHLFDMIPFILKEEEAVIKNAIEGQHLGIVFDGTTRHGEAMAIVLRFVSDFWTIEQCVVRVQLVSKSMKGEEIARELIHVLSSTYSIKPDKIVAAMHDHACQWSSNENSENCVSFFT